MPVSSMGDEVEQAMEQEVARLARNATRAGHKAGLRVRAEARAGAPHDSGSLEYSIYVSTSDGESTYADDVGASEGANPRVIILPEDAPYQGSLPDESQMFQGIAETVVGVAAKHGFFVENGYGPEGRRPPKPFFEKATVNAEDYYLEELESSS